MKLSQEPEAFPRHVLGSKARVLLARVYRQLVHS